MNVNTFANLSKPESDDLHSQGYFFNVSFPHIQSKRSDFLIQGILNPTYLLDTSHLKIHYVKHWPHLFSPKTCSIFKKHTHPVVRARKLYVSLDPSYSIGTGHACVFLSFQPYSSVLSTPAPLLLQLF